MSSMRDLIPAFALGGRRLWITDCIGLVGADQSREQVMRFAGRGTSTSSRYRQLQLPTARYISTAYPQVVLRMNEAVQVPGEY